jgi:hypothetical protein
MNDIGMQREILSVLMRLDGIAVRETILATETEIAVKHPLTTAEFRREIGELVGMRRVKRSFDPFGEALYEITGAGRDALMGRG